MYSCILTSPTILFEGKHPCVLSNNPLKPVYLNIDEKGAWTSGQIRIFESLKMFGKNI